MKHHRILLVEDDGELAAMISQFLSKNEFEVSVEGRGDIAVRRIVQENPDVVILDVNLPGLDGFDVCRAVRSEFHGTIIMLTARGDEVDEVLGLEVGADDYMAKPVRPMALLARLGIHLRRAATDVTSSAQPMLIGSLLIDPARRFAKLDQNILDLTSAEFDLLKLLADHVGKTLSRQEIHLAIHGLNYDGQDRSIDLRISRLRRKLGDDPIKPRRIKSVRGTGYQLSAEP